MTREQALTDLRFHFSYLDEKWKNNRDYVARVNKAWTVVETMLSPENAEAEAQINALAEMVLKDRNLLRISGLSVKGVAHAEEFPADYIESFAEWVSRNKRIAAAPMEQKIELYTMHYRQLKKVIETKIATLEQYRFFKTKKLSEVTRFLRADYAELRHWFDKIDDDEQFDNETVGKTIFDYLINP